MRTHIRKTETNGSVLIVTIVVTAVLLAIGVTLSSVLEKDVLRQTYARRSQVAMNIANSALECALFNDLQRHVFDSLFSSRYTVVDCGALYQVREGTDWSVLYTSSSDENDADPAGTGSYNFVVIQSEAEDLTSTSNVPCADITIEKQCSIGLDPVISTICQNGLIKKSIEVKGYSSCSSGDASTRELVRRFKIFY